MCNLPQFAIYKSYQRSHPHKIYHETPQEYWISFALQLWNRPRKLVPRCSLSSGKGNNDPAICRCFERRQKCPTIRQTEISVRAGTSNRTIPCKQDYRQDYCLQLVTAVQVIITTYISLFRYFSCPSHDKLAGKFEE